MKDIDTETRNNTVADDVTAGEEIWLSNVA